MNDPALKREETRHDKTLTRLGYKHIKRGRMVRVKKSRRKTAR